MSDETVQPMSLNESDRQPPFLLRVDNPQPEWSERRKLLMDTVQLIDGERNSDYGEPIDDFSQTALMIQTYLDGITRVRGSLIILPHDVAVIQTFVKLSRLITSPAKRDHWADIVGYAGCGWDTVVASGQSS
jgi:hypothetical protein